MASAGMVGSVLFAVVATASGPASAATFGNGFMDIGGTIQYDGTGAVGWGNHGTVTSTGCSNGGQNVVETPTAHGLFNCGAKPTAFPDPAALPTYNSSLGGANGVFAHAFVPNIQGVPVTGCSGTGGYSTGGKFNDNLSADSYNLGGAPDVKDQIGNIYAAARANPTTGNDEVYVGVERFVNNGDSHIAFEFLQEPVAMTNPCGGTNLVAGDRVQGDIALEIDFTNGGTAATPTVLVWSCSGSLPLPDLHGASGICGSSPANWVIEPACGGSVTTNCYNPDAVTVTSNTAQIPCGGWACENGTTVPTNEFGEGAIDIDALGLNAGCASSFIVISKSSQSPTADIHGVAPPVSFDTCTGTTTQTTPTSSAITLGGSNTDSAVVTANAGTKAPTGSVTFYECGPLASAAGCDPTSAGATKIGTVSTPTSTSGLSTTYTSPSFIPPSVAGGTYCFAGVFTPAVGSKLVGSQDGSSTECFTVNPIKPGFTTNPTSTSITFGGSNTDSATVAGNSAGGVPGGSASFSICKESTVGTPCTGGTSVATAAPTAGTPSGDSRTFNSASAKPTSTGTWCFNASYSAGSGSNYTDVSAETNAAAECFTVNAADTKTATIISNTNITFGPSGTVTDNVTVTGNSGGPAPSGTVDFYFCQTGTNASALQPGPCAVSAGNLEDSKAPLTASLTDLSSSTGSSTTATPTAPGTWCFGAVYSGDGNYNGSQDNTTDSNTDSAECVLVAKAPSQTTTTVQGASGAVTNASVGDKATVSGFSGGPTPTGPVVFTLYSAGSALSSGVSCTDASQPATTVVNVTGNPDTESLSGGTATTAAPLGPLPAGNYGYEAVYNGDSNYMGSTGKCEPFTVAPASTSTATALQGTDGAQTNSSVSDQATVTTAAIGPFTPLGSVTFTLYSAGSALSSGVSCTDATQPATTLVNVTGNPDSDVPLSSGSASSGSFGPLAAGHYGIEAVYSSSNNNFTGSTAKCEPFTVAPASTSTATALQGTDGAQTGASVSDQATVTTAAIGPFTPQGSVTFTLYSAGSALSSGASCTDATQPATTLVNVTGNPDSDVPLSSGSASSGSFGPLAAGHYGIEAVYSSSNNNFTGSTAKCEPFDVGPAPTNTATTPNGVDGAQTGASVTDTATVSTSVTSFAPTGSASFTLYSSDTPLSSDSACTADGQPATTVVDVTGNPDSDVPLSSGSATSGSFGPLPAGNYGFEAVFTSGDNNFTGSTGNCEPFSVGLAPTGTTTTVINNGTGSAWVDGGAADAAPASVHDTSSVSNEQGGIVPTGSVTYTLYNGDCTGTVVGSDTEQLNADGSVPPSKDFTGLAAGQYGFIAVYSGDNHYATSTGDCEPFTVLVPPTVSASKTESTPGTPPTNCTTTATTVLCATVNPFDPTTNLITYNITLTNSGQLDELNATVTDPIPAGVTVGTIGQGGTSDGTNITWTGVNVPVDGTTTLTFTATVNNTDTNGQTIVNQATVTVPSTDIEVPGDGPGSSCDGNTCQTNTVSNPVAFPIVSYVKKSTPANGSTVKRGDTIVYEIDATNTGGADATNVVVTDTVPAGTTFVSAANGGTEANGTVTWTIPTLAAGATTAVHFTVTVNSDDTSGQVIDNVALATDVNTPNCAGAATCDTNHVKQTVLVPTPATAPAVSTTTTTKPKPALAFTGADVLRTVEIAFGALAGGALLLLASRRRRRSS